MAGGSRIARCRRAFLVDAAAALLTGLVGVVCDFCELLNTLSEAKARSTASIAAQLFVAEDPHRHPFSCFLFRNALLYVFFPSFCFRSNRRAVRSAGVGAARSVPPPDLPAASLLQADA